jgi:uncharacterized protein YidB (DUF937 family)
MGFFDEVIASSAFKQVVGQVEAAAVPIVLHEVLGNDSQGGINTILQQLQKAGLGDTVNSWLGQGKNIQITPEQLRSVLSNDQVKQLCARFGIPADQLMQLLAQQLPAAVDHASPNGSIPKQL